MQSALLVALAAIGGVVGDGRVVFYQDAGCEGATAAVSMPAEGVDCFPVPLTVATGASAGAHALYARITPCSDPQGHRVTTYSDSSCSTQSLSGNGNVAAGSCRAISYPSSSAGSFRALPATTCNTAPECSVPSATISYPADREPVPVIGEPYGTQQAIGAKLQNGNGDDYTWWAFDEIRTDIVLTIQVPAAATTVSRLFLYYETPFNVDVEITLTAGGADTVWTDTQGGSTKYYISPDIAVTERDFTLRLKPIVNANAAPFEIGVAEIMLCVDETSDWAHHPASRDSDVCLLSEPDNCAISPSGTAPSTVLCLGDKTSQFTSMNQCNITTKPTPMSGACLVTCLEDLRLEIGVDSDPTQMMLYIMDPNVDAVLDRNIFLDVVAIDAAMVETVLANATVSFSPQGPTSDGYRFRESNIRLNDWLDVDPYDFMAAQAAGVTWRITVSNVQHSGVPGGQIQSATKTFSYPAAPTAVTTLAAFAGQATVVLQWDEPAAPGRRWFEFVGYEMQGNTQLFQEQHLRLDESGFVLQVPSGGFFDCRTEQLYVTVQEYDESGRVGTPAQSPPLMCTDLDAPDETKFLVGVTAEGPFDSEPAPRAHTSLTLSARYTGPVDNTMTWFVDIIPMGTNVIQLSQTLTTTSVSSTSAVLDVVGLLNDRPYRVQARYTNEFGVVSQWSNILVIEPYRSAGWFKRTETCDGMCGFTEVEATGRFEREVICTTEQADIPQLEYNELRCPADEKPQSGDACVRTCPDAPTDVTVTASNGAATLTWTGVADVVHADGHVEPIIHYIAYARDTTEENVVPIWTYTNETCPECHDFYFPGLENGVRYEFWVRAFTSDKEMSQVSNKVMATPNGDCKFDCGADGACVQGLCRCNRGYGGEECEFRANATWIMPRVDMDVDYKVTPAFQFEFYYDNPSDLEEDQKVDLLIFRSDCADVFCVPVQIHRSVLPTPTFDGLRHFVALDTKQLFLRYGAGNYFARIFVSDDFVVPGRNSAKINLVADSRCLANHADYVNCEALGTQSDCRDGECVCKQGFGGSTCAIVWDSCRTGGVNCGLFGECSASGSCTCKQGFTGAACEYGPGCDLECDMGAPSQGGRDCELDGCECVHGYKGLTCDECALRCAHGGEPDDACFECVCGEFYTGSDCQVSAVTATISFDMSTVDGLVLDTLISTESNYDDYMAKGRIAWEMDEGVAWGKGLEYLWLKEATTVPRRFVELLEGDLRESLGLIGSDETYCNSLTVDECGAGQTCGLGFGGKFICFDDAVIDFECQLDGNACPDDHSCRLGSAGKYTCQRVQNPVLDVLSVTKTGTSTFDIMLRFAGEDRESERNNLRDAMTHFDSALYHTLSGQYIVAESFVKDDPHLRTLSGASTAAPLSALVCGVLALFALLQ